MQDERTTLHLLHFAPYSRRTRLKGSSPLRRFLLDMPASNATMLSLVGTLFYASRALRHNVAGEWYAIKFLRKRMAQLKHLDALEQPVRYWAGMKTQLARWAEQVLENRPTAHPVDGPAEPLVLFSDASLQGWGAVVITRRDYLGQPCRPRLPWVQFLGGVVAARSGDSPLGVARPWVRRGDVRRPGAGVLSHLSLLTSLFLQIDV
jgi:hypothetical protein